MRRFDKKRIISEANQRLEKNYLKSKGFLTEDKKPKEIKSCYVQAKVRPSVRDGLAKIAKKENRSRNYQSHQN